jgi:hypothetical protein
MSADLIAKVLAQRESWVDLEDGKRVKIRRPAEAQMPAFRAGVTPERVVRCCVDWDGFSEADVLGAALGSGNSKVAFAVDLWEVLALDRMDWLEKVSSSLVEAITSHLSARSDAAKNFEPS